jgi:holin (3TMs family)
LAFPFSLLKPFTRIVKPLMPLRILEFFFDIIGKAVTNKDEAAKIKSKISEMAQNNELSELYQASKLVQSEINSESWLQKSWRPILMLSIVGILINKYLFIPYLHAFSKIRIDVFIPEAFFDLLMIGVGGYVVGRSVEKGIRHWRNPDS